MATDGDHLPARRERRGTGLYTSLFVALALAVGILVGIIQNLQTVELKYFVWDLRTPLIVVLLVSVLATVMLSTLVGAAWRHRRRGGYYILVCVGNPWAAILSMLAGRGVWQRGCLAV